MNTRREYRDINGHLLGSSLPSGSDRLDYFNAEGQRLGYADASNTYNSDGQMVAKDAIGQVLLNWKLGVD